MGLNLLHLRNIWFDMVGSFGLRSTLWLGIGALFCSILPRHGVNDEDDIFSILLMYQGSSFGLFASKWSVDDDVVNDDVDIFHFVDIS